MLELQDVVVAYGSTVAVKGISMSIAAGSFVSVLGANGAGKSSLLRAVTGLVRPRSGQVRFTGTAVERWQPERIVRLGLVMVPERRELFPEMSVHENLEMGAYMRRDRPEIQGDLEWVYSLFPTLAAKRRQRAAGLSGGQQQMVAIARALMSRPRLLLLDEPSLGLAPLLVDQIFDAIRTIHRRGTTIVLVEQNARFALECADYGYVLADGKVVLAGPSADLAGNDLVRKSYLGAI